MGNALRFIGLLLAASLCMAGFFLITGFVKFAFSLAALLIGIQFFKRFSGLASRIGFVVSVVALSILFSLLYIMLAYVSGWPLDPRYTNGITPPA